MTRSRRFGGSFPGGISLLATFRRCFALTLVSVAACSPGSPVDVSSNPTSDAGPFSLSGYVLKGPVSGAIVTADKLPPDLTGGGALGTATTGETGFFGLTLPPYNGDVLLVANGGTYVEQALPPDEQGTPRRLALDRELFGVALDIQTGQPATANITPVSHLGVHLARFHAKQGEDGHQALVDTFAYLGSYFGNGPGVTPPVDWLTFVPAPEGSGAQLTPADRAALVLSGLSQLALDVSLEAGLSPGGKVNALSLLSALAEDLEADGIFDGKGIMRRDGERALSRTSRARTSRAFGRCQPRTIRPVCSVVRIGPAQAAN